MKLDIFSSSTYYFDFVRKFYGILSANLALLAVIAATLAMFRVSSNLGWLYSIISIAGIFTAIVVFCAKCRCKHACAHVLPGRLATRFKRNQSPYTGLELAITIIAISPLVVIPQYWLFFEPLLMAIFWIFLLSAFAIISTRVCPQCENSDCPVSKSSKDYR